MISLQVDPYLNTNHSAFITTGTARALKLLNKQWISVEKTVSNNGVDSLLTMSENIVKEKFEKCEERKTWYPLQVNIYSSFDEEKSYTDDVIYVSTSDLFNILSHSPGLYKQYYDQKIEISFETLRDISTYKEKYTASHSTISLLYCPYGNCNDNLVDDLLKEHFQKRRLMSPKEIFPIFVQSHQKISRDTPFVFWFRVDNLVAKDTSHVHQNNGRFVGMETELVLGKNTESYIPFCGCMVKNRPLLFELFLSKDLRSAYQSYLHQLTDSLRMLKTGKVSTADTAILVEAPTGYGKGIVLQVFCFDQCLHFTEVNCLDVVSESFAATEKRLKTLVDNVKSSRPCVLYLKNIHALCKDKEGEKEERRLVSYFANILRELDCHELPLLLVASTNKVNQMSARFFSLFMYHLCLDAPSADERKHILNTLLNCRLKEANEIALKTSGFFLSDLIELVRKASPLFRKMLEERHPGEGGEDEISIPECKELFLKAVDEVRSVKSGTLTNVKVQKVTWKDVGGLENVKKDIFDTIELPMKFPTLFRKNMRRSGLLFYGPPGCGKTLLAKAVATEFNLNFYSVKGPELINMYVGQSEENVRETFKTARRMAPCVVFFDEIDSLAPNRGRTGDSGGVMDRIVSQLLSELDGMHDNTNVFIIAATNRPDLLDAALLRPGRFDKLVYVGIPEGRNERLKLLRAVTQKIHLSPEISLEEIVEKLPANLTGADFKALASNAVMCCIKRMIIAHENQKIPLNVDQAIVSMEDFEEAITSCSPSVSIEELERYKSIQDEITRK
ncbi:peroxisomal ATPase PEX6-like [Clytia hemisphaerica]|uniref:peroxisomal ATPase PEX6-like n=1 Tax=Clytia hemisphaerica TaxID=252671 RepID=UPI0034D63707